MSPQSRRNRNNIDSRGSYDVPANQLGLTKTDEGALLPTVIGVQIRKEMLVPDCISRFTQRSIDGKELCVLVLHFLGTAPYRVEFTFDLQECFPWLVLVARSEKMCLIDNKSDSALGLTVRPEVLRNSLLHYYARWAMNHETSWNRELGPLAVAKTIGLPLSSELGQKVPDLLQVFLDYVGPHLNSSP